MPPDLWQLYSLMFKCRRFEEAVAKLWHDGLISGEMHLGTGEEAIVAGVVSLLQEGDALALDHRGTAALLVRGVDPVLLVRELLGYPEGLCGGRGGHMHLFSQPHLAVSSGIVGASGPAATGFGLAAQYQNPGAVAVAFFGEGAMNQGMLLESLNLAAVWQLPVIFVCKNDGWAIASTDGSMIAGDLNERARGLGVPAFEIDGRDVSDVWQAAQTALKRARSGQGPTFLHARCVHFEAHFLGFQLLRMVRHPLREMPRVAVPLTHAILKKDGEPFRIRLAGLRKVLAAVWRTVRDPRRGLAHDPLWRTRRLLRADLSRLQAMENDLTREVDHIIASALVGVPS